MHVISLNVASFIFLMMSIMQLLRLVLKVKITVNDKVAPLWLSAIASPVMLLLAIHMFIAARQ